MPHTEVRPGMRMATALFLVVEGTGAIAWWTALLLFPEKRIFFLAPGAPDTTLLAFIVPDIPLFVGGSLLAAYGVLRSRNWAWPVLCVHAGAAGYAALYAIALPVLRVCKRITFQLCPLNQA